MTITKTTHIDLIGFDVADKGELEVRFAKCTWQDGELIAREPHRTAFQPGDDIDAQMTEVNQSLVGMGFTPVPAQQVKLIKAAAEIQWTPKRVKARKDRDIARNAEEERQRILAEAAATEAANATKVAEDARLKEAVEAVLEAKK